MNPPALAVPTQMMSLQQVAAALHLSVKTVRRMVDRGDLPVHRIGRSVRVTCAAYENYLTSAQSGKGEEMP